MTGSGHLSNRRALWEAALVSATSVALIIFLVLLGPTVPFIQENLYSFVAIVLIYLPVIVLRWQRRDWRDFALTFRGSRLGLSFAFVVAIAVLPPYTVGFHVWQEEVAGATLGLDLSNYHRWPRAMQGPPARFSPIDAHVWISEGDLSVQLPPGLRGRLATDGVLALRSGAALQSGSELVITAQPARHAVTVDVRRSRSFTLQLFDGNAPLDPTRIRLGADSHLGNSHEVQAARDLVWLLNFVLTQLLLVALSEEIFYRGYLQTRLDEAFPPRRRILGAPIGISLVITSIVFALTHLAAHRSPVVLAVFFPSLIFGWLRARTGSIVGSVAFHGLCNIWVQLLAVHYVAR